MLKIKIFSAILLVLLSNAAFCGNNNDTGYFSGRDLHLKAEQLTSYQPQTDQYIFVLDQQVSLAFGADTYSADKAVIWLETVGSQYLGKTSIDYQVNAYLQGNIVQNKNKHISAIKSRSIDGGSQMTLQFRVNGEVFLTADTKQTLDPRDTDFYKQARSSIVSDKPLFVIQPGAVVPGLADKTSDLQETKIAGKKKKSFFSRIFKTKTADTNTSTETATQPGQVPPAETAVEQKAAKAPKFTYPIGIAPATDTPIELQSAAADDGSEIAIITERFYIWQKQDEKGSLLELMADNAVIFYSSKSNDPNTQGKYDNLNSQNNIKAVYLSGDVLLTEGKRTIRADEMFYDFENKNALAVNAVMRSFDVKRNMPIYVRAAKLRQIAENKFSAEDIVLTSSEFYKPQVSATAAKILITDTTDIDEQAGKLSDDSFQAEMYDVRMKYGKRTILKRPFMKTNMQRADLPIKRVSIGNDNTLGTSLETNWYLSRLLGYAEPEGMESTFNFDYYSKRGVGAGVGIEYKREDYYGAISSYLIKDKGDDRLGRDSTRRNLEPDNELRGRFAWKHRQFLPSNWQLTSNIDYISDENFFESFFRDEFNASPGSETYLHLKRIEDNWGLSFLGKARINDFADELEEFPTIEFHRVGQSLFDDKFTFYNDSQISRMRQRIGDRHTLAIDEGIYSFAYTRSELDMPLKRNGYKLIPYVAGTFAYDDRSGFTRTLVDGTNSGSFGTDMAWIGEAGIRFFPNSFWKVYPNVKSRLWDLNQIRHIVSPSITAVTFVENDKAVEQRDTLNIALAQRLQTKRGSGDDEQTVDWMRLDAEVTWVNDSASQPSGPDRFIWAKPFVPMRVFSAPEIFNGDLISSLGRFEDFGPKRNYFGIDYIWRVSDTTAVLSDMHYDLQSGVFDQFNIGFTRLVWPNLSYYLGSRYLRNTQILDEKGSNALTFAATYVLDPRYTLVFAQQFDFDYGANIRSDITLIRSYHRMRYGFTYSADSSLDRQAIVISIWPQGVPELAIGQRRYIGMGGAAGY